MLAQAMAFITQKVNAATSLRGKMPIQIASDIPSKMLRNMALLVDTVFAQSDQNQVPTQQIPTQSISIQQELTKQETSHQTDKCAQHSIHPAYSQATYDKRIAIIGSGIKNNNILLSSLLQAHISQWYFIHLLVYQLRSLVCKNVYKDKLPDAFAGWGHKKSYQCAANYAKTFNRPVISLEDGFLRSITSGYDTVNGRYTCSLVVDDVGLYSKLQTPSALENKIIARQINWTQTHNDRARRCMSQIRRYQLSKYNQSNTCFNLAQRSNTGSANHILVVDQVIGDESIVGAGLNANIKQAQKQFELMLHTACSNHSTAQIWIKTHPAKKSGYLNNAIVLNKLPKQDAQRLHIIDDAVNVIALLTQVEHVYTVSSHMGFEALLLGKLVHCFGVNWYSGWGLTDDTHAPLALLEHVKLRRNQNQGCHQPTVDDAQVLSQLHIEALAPSVEQLFYAAYIDYSVYADPASGESCQIEQVIYWLHTNRNWYHKLPKQAMIYEFSRWKVPFVKDFLNIIYKQPDSKFAIKSKPSLLATLKSKYQRHYDWLDSLLNNYEQDIIVWGLASRQSVQHRKHLRDLHKRQNQRCHADKSVHDIWCMEDGFVRSNGLGATLLPPLSVVLDQQGIYYDANRPSDLEVLLQTCADLADDEVARVQRLILMLQRYRVSKYHVGSEKPLFESDAQGDKDIERVLIVGQVEDDLSVKNCASNIQTNEQLIEQVVQDNPNAYLIYKPHPDVEAGLRKGKVSLQVLRQVDKVAKDIAMPNCLDAVDSVHTISSLTGFEALLRGKEVVCYGLPFYAGWGLTIDRNPSRSDRRHILTRRRLAVHRQQKPLTLAQLVHIALIQYPMYRLPKGYGLAQVEQVITYLYQNESSNIVNATLANQDAHRTKHKLNRDNVEATQGSYISRASKSVVILMKAHLQRAKRNALTKFMQMRHALIQMRKEY